MGPRPYRDRETLRKCAIRGVTVDEMADQFDCSPTTIKRWYRKHNLDKQLLRTPAYEMLQGSKSSAAGYMEWRHMHDGETYRLQVHRLLAIAEYGYDDVVKNVVHHKNGLRWDNRPTNIELKANDTHSRDHATDDHGVGPRLRDPAELQACYGDRESVGQLREELNCSSRTLYKYLHEHDIIE